MLITEKKLRVVIRKIIKENHPWDHIMDYLDQYKNNIKKDAKIFYKKYCSITWYDSSKSEFVFSFKPNFNKTREGDEFIEFFEETIDKIAATPGFEPPKRNKICNKNFVTQKYEGGGAEGLFWITKIRHHSGSIDSHQPRLTVHTMTKVYGDIIEELLKKLDEEHGVTIGEIDHLFNHDIVKDPNVKDDF